MKTLITALSALTVLFAFTATPALADDKKSGAKTYSVSVSGVVWKVNCPPRVRAALQKVDGVDKVAFDAKSKVATLTMKAGKTADKAAAEKALKGTRYKVAKFEEGGKKKKTTS